MASMTPAQLNQIREIRKSLRARLANQLTYPKVVIGIAKTRPLSENEVLLAQEYLEECLRLVDAQLTLLLGTENHEPHL